MKVEHAWEEHFRDRPVVTLCPYVVGGLDAPAALGRLADLGAGHHDGVLVPSGGGLELFRADVGPATVRSTRREGGTTVVRPPDRVISLSRRRQSGRESPARPSPSRLGRARDRLRRAAAASLGEAPPPAPRRARAGTSDPRRRVSRALGRRSRAMPHAIVRCSGWRHGSARPRSCGPLDVAACQIASRRLVEWELPPCEHARERFRTAP